MRKNPNRGRRYKVQFKTRGMDVDGVYTAREFCIFLVDRYSLTESEVSAVFALEDSDAVENEQMTITRVL